MKNPVFKTKSRSGSRVTKKATTYAKTDEGIIFRLYGTDIVKVYHSMIVLNSGGYRTVTTKRRMNQISNELELGFKVLSIKGEWVVLYDGEWHRFNDGMKLHK